MKKKLKLLGFYYYAKLTAFHYAVKVANGIFRLRWRPVYLISIRDTPFPIALRAGSTDYDCFHQIFVQEEYRFVKDRPIMSFLDLGANIGLTALYLRMNTPVKTVISVEPDPENFHMLERNTKYFPEIQVIKAGVWDKKTRLNVRQGNFGNGGEWAIEVFEDPSGPIEAVTIPSLIKAYPGMVDMVKIDIEGSENRVLKDTSWLERAREICVECHNDEAREMMRAIAEQHASSVQMHGEMHCVKLWNTP